MIPDWIHDWLTEANWRRWSGRLLGFGFVALWAWLIFWKIDEKNGLFAAACIAFPAFGSLVAGAILIAPTLASWVAAPFLKFIDSVYLGSHIIERPPLSFDVAERLIRERRWEDAAAELERIAYWHPKDARAWNNAICCLLKSGDSVAADRLYRRARVRCFGVLPPAAIGLTILDPPP